MNSAICKSTSSPVDFIFVDKPGGSSGNIISRAMSTLYTWSQRSRQRKQLGQLDERLLKDIGIAYEEAWAEINKPFWQQ